MQSQKTVISSWSGKPVRARQQPAQQETVQQIFTPTIFFGTATAEIPVLAPFRQQGNVGPLPVYPHGPYHIVTPMCQSAATQSVMQSRACSSRSDAQATSAAALAAREQISTIGEPQSNYFAVTPMCKKGAAAQTSEHSAGSSCSNATSITLLPSPSPTTCSRSSTAAGELATLATAAGKKAAPLNWRAPVFVPASASGTAVSSHAAEADSSSDEDPDAPSPCGMTSLL